MKKFKILLIALLLLPCLALLTACGSIEGTYSLSSVTLKGTFGEYELDGTYTKADYLELGEKEDKTEKEQGIYEILDDLLKDSMVIELKSNGEALSKEGDKDADIGSWAEKDGKIVVTNSNGDELKFEKSGKNLNLKITVSDGIELTYTFSK